MISRPCYKCYHLFRVDDMYDRFCKNGLASKRCPICGVLNHVQFEMDGKITLSKEK